MKILNLTSLTLSLFCLFSCVGQENKNEENTPTTYICPMKCENEKVYPAAGNCPVCEMDLIQQ